MESKLLPSCFQRGKKYGPEWRAAKEWEEEQQKLAQQSLKTLTDLEKLMAWGDNYLNHCERMMSRQTFVEKQTVLRRFFDFCGKEKIEAIEEITSAKAYRLLSTLKDERGANVANKYRKNLMSAWKWGMDFEDDFPQIANPFTKVKPFPVDRKERYVPSEEDIIKVLQQAKGQDLVFLLTMYFTGARRGELFRLRWEDVDLQENKIRLVDHKTESGNARVCWQEMHPELVKALSWWQKIAHVKLKMYSCKHIVTNLWENHIVIACILCKNYVRGRE